MVWRFGVHGHECSLLEINYHISEFQFFLFFFSDVANYLCQKHVKNHVQTLCILGYTKNTTV
jgi:hypothetical protein